MKSFISKRLIVIESVIITALLMLLIVDGFSFKFCLLFLLSLPCSVFMGLEWKRNGGSIKKTEKVNNNNYKILPVNYKITTTRIPLLYLEEVDEEIKALNFMGHYHTVPLFEKDLIKIRRGEFGNLI